MNDRPVVLNIEGVRKYFRRRNGAHVPAIDGIDLKVVLGEFVVLLGPSGCGKTTLLRCIAGLETPDAGVIDIHRERQYSSATGVNAPPERRKLGMVFQSYALWPHMKVYSNVAYPLQVRKVDRNRIRQQVSDVLAKVGVGDLSEQYPGQLSGGQQQRVALARALVSSSGLLLFDEPLSNVDAKVREQLRHEIRQMQREIGFAAIYVTHDQEEAMELADRIAVLNAGKIAQLGSPQEIYNTPADRYVAKFIGGTNEVSGRVTSIDPSGILSLSTDAGPVLGVSGDAGVKVGSRVGALIRPENIVLGPGQQEQNTWTAKFVANAFVGANQRVTAHIEGWGKVLVSVSSSENIAVEDGQVKIYMPPRSVRIYSL